MKDDANHLSGIKAFAVPLIIIVGLWLVLFVPAGSVKFWEAWIWWAIIAAMTLFITIYFLKKDPSLLSRRMKVKEKEQQPGIVRVLSFLSLFTYLVPGFDYRYNWSTVPTWLIIAANGAVFLGYVFIFLVFKENSYASTIIQVEEEQPVITTGPYAIVRHPMYSGLLLMLLFTPLALGSYWGLLFSFFFIPKIVIRILSLLNNVADTPSKLSRDDVRRIADMANTAGILKGFADWLVTQEELRPEVLRAFRNYISGEYRLVC